jgi:hypothetical protein
MCTATTINFSNLVESKSFNAATYSIQMGKKLSLKFLTLLYIQTNGRTQDLRILKGCNCVNKISDFIFFEQAIK